MMAAKFEQLMLNIMSRFPNRQFTSPTVIAWSEQTAREYSPGKALRNENLITSLSTQLSEQHGNSILANIHQK